MHAILYAYSRVTSRIKRVHVQMHAEHHVALWLYTIVIHTCCLGVWQNTDMSNAKGVSKKTYLHIEIRHGYCTYLYIYFRNTGINLADVCVCVRVCSCKRDWINGLMHAVKHFCECLCGHSRVDSCRHACLCMFYHAGMAVCLFACLCVSVYACLCENVIMNTFIWYGTAWHGMEWHARVSCVCAHVCASHS